MIVASTFNGHKAIVVLEVCGFISNESKGNSGGGEIGRGANDGRLEQSGSSIPPTTMISNPFSARFARALILTLFAIRFAHRRGNFCRRYGNRGNGIVKVIRNVLRGFLRPQISSRYINENQYWQRRQWQLGKRVGRRCRRRGRCFQRMSRWLRRVTNPRKFH